MIRTVLAPVLALLGLSLAPLSAADLKLVPAEVRLSGPQATQRLLVLTEENGKVACPATTHRVRHRAPPSDGWLPQPPDLPPR